MILVFSMNDVYAEIFQSSNDDNYLFLNISNDKAFALLKIDGNITSIQEEDIKYYKNGSCHTPQALQWVPNKTTSKAFKR